MHDSSDPLHLRSIALPNGYTVFLRVMFQPVPNPGILGTSQSNRHVPDCPIPRGFWNIGPEALGEKSVRWTALRRIRAAPVPRRPRPTRNPPSVVQSPVHGWDTKYSPPKCMPQKEGSRTSLPYRTLASTRPAARLGGRPNETSRSRRRRVAAAI